MDWVWVVAATWLLLAFAAALLIGRAIRRADDSEREVQPQAEKALRPALTGPTTRPTPRGV
jgi:membrane protein implicated in regulation of membrane protease activity